MEKLYVVSIDEEFEKARPKGAKDKKPRRKRYPNEKRRTHEEALARKERIKNRIGKPKAMDPGLRRYLEKRGEIGIWSI